MKNTKNTTRRLYCLLLVVGLISSCTKDFEEMNTDPNNPVDVPAINIFTNAVQSSVYLELCDLQIVCIGLWCQQWCEIQYIASDQYRPYDMTYWFYAPYTQALKNFTIVRDKAAKEGRHVLEAAAKIMIVWNFMYLTDLWGDVPYNEALQGFDVDGTIHPKYDTVESIYTDLLKELEEANNLLTGISINFGSGDILYNGNPMQWNKFGNSLRMRLLNRVAGTPWSFTYDMSGTQPNVTTTEGSAVMSDADAQIGEILSNPTKYPIFESNDDNAALVYPGFPYRNPIYDLLQKWDVISISETIVDWLKARNDPRIHIYAQPTPNSIDSPPLEYTGFQNGLNVTAAHFPEISLLGTKIAYNETAPLYVMCYDEVEFIKAEYYKRLNNDIAARKAYEKGIAASMERWGLVDGSTVYPTWGQSEITADSTGYPVDYALYLTNPLNAWSGTDSHKYKLICEQRWAAMFGQGIQAYSEVRRTGFPERIFEYEIEGTFYPNMGLPVRLPYAISEESYNTDMLAAARLAENIDLTNDGIFSTNGIISQIWWNTRKNPIPTETDVH